MTITKTKDFYSALVLLAGVGVLYNESLSIDTLQNYALGPLFFPYILMTIVVIFSLVLLFQSISFSGVSKKEERKPFVVTDALKMQIFIVGLMVLYIVFLPVVSYIPATFVFLVISILALGKKTRKNMLLGVIIAAVTTGALYFVFGHVMLLFLP